MNSPSRVWNTALPQDTLMSIQQGSLNYSYRGIPMIKNPFDFALYPLMLWNLKPKTIIEIGSFMGGSAVWFGDLLESFGIDGHVYSIDINKVTTVTHPRVTYVAGSGRNLQVVLDPEFLNSLPRPFLVIEDADHFYETTRAVLDFFHPYLQPNEYIVIEDGIVSDLGEMEQYHGGPNRAIAEFLETYENEYEIDHRYCDFFGHNLTWCTNGFLRRVSNPLMGNPGSQTLNLIAFPDWMQGEESLLAEMEGLIKAICLSNCSDIHLIIYISNTSAETSSLILSAAALNLFEKQNIEVSEELKISFLSAINQQRWATILPSIHYRVPLEFEDKAVIQVARASGLPMLEINRLSNLK